MSFKNIPCLLAVVCLTLVLPGCGGGEGGRSGRGRFAFARRGAAREAARERSLKASELDGMSPEGSMQRDLEQLRERERQQVKTVSEMRAALDKGEGVVEKEELKLQEIRSQIADFNMAVRGFEYSRTSGTRDGGDYVTPAVASSMYGEGEGGGRRSRFVSTAKLAEAAERRAVNERNNAGGRGYDRRNVSYDRDENSRGGYDEPQRNAGRNSFRPGSASANRGRDDYSRPDYSGNEEMLYDSRNQYQDSQGLNGGSGGGNDFLFDSPYAAPAPAPRRMPPAMSYDANVDAEDDDDFLPNGNMYSNSPSSRQPAMPRPAAVQRSPAASGGDMPPPAVRNRPPAPKAESAPPLGVTGGNDYVDDEVFSPDMFLSGGR